MLAEASEGEDALTDHSEARARLEGIGWGWSRFGFTNSLGHEKNEAWCRRPQAEA